MALENRLELRLSQKLILTPQLQQAIKLLQMPYLELSQFLSQELIENPFLEETADEVSADELTPEEKDSIEVEEPDEDAGAPLEKLMNFSVDEYFEDRISDGRDVGYFNPGTITPPSFEQFLSRKPDLYDHLLWQLRLNDFSEEERLIGTMIIGNLNEDGQLQVPLEEIASQNGFDPATVEGVIRKVQAFDPPGVAARDLRECLLLQAQQVFPGEKLVQKIISDHLGLLAKKNFQAIAKDLQVPMEEVVRITRLIIELDPKPGRGFSEENIPYITPDVYVYKVGDEYIVVLNEDGLPKLRINPYYRDILREKAQPTGGAKEYINEKIRSALWLIKSIHQRQRTIYRVAKSIVKFQREFLDKGVAYLRPMVLKDVAMDVEMHESTISRVTSNKYVHTPQGIFELKYFFNSSINTARGENIASESVKAKIREILSKEDGQNPYSDQELVEILRKQDILIARRTVTKYREMLGVLPSTRRKKIA